MRSGVIRIRVRCLRPWRTTSWPAACGIRWVNPSMATESPSRSTSSTASARDRTRDILKLSERVDLGACRAGSFTCRRPAPAQSRGRSCRMAAHRHGHSSQEYWRGNLGIVDKRINREEAMNIVASGISTAAVAALATVAAVAAAAPALAQQPTAGNLEKLSGFKTTGTAIDIPHVPQTGAKAEAIKKNLA